MTEQRDEADPGRSQDPQDQTTDPIAVPEETIEEFSGTGEPEGGSEPVASEPEVVEAPAEVGGVEPAPAEPTGTDPEPVFGSGPMDEPPAEPTETIPEPVVGSGLVDESPAEPTETIPEPVVGSGLVDESAVEPTERIPEPVVGSGPVEESPAEPTESIPEPVVGSAAVATPVEPTLVEPAAETVPAPDEAADEPTIHQQIPTAPLVAPVAPPAEPTLAELRTKPEPTQAIFRDSPPEPEPEAEPTRLDALGIEEQRLAAERAARKEARDAALAASAPVPLVAPVAPVVVKRTTDGFFGSLGLFLLRLVVAAIFAIRGLNMLTDLAGTQQLFAQTVIPEPAIMSIVTGVACLLIALALVLGLLTRVAGLGVALIAGGSLAFVQWGAAWSPMLPAQPGQPGFLGETELVLAAVGILLLCVGGGGWGLDRSFRSSRAADKAAKEAAA
jgi:uncharacterized membrane protein YphA (DoxX/SURF4 family)